MEPDILLYLQQYPDYKEGRTTAMPMCAVCKYSLGRKCKIFGKRPENVTKKYEVCEKAVLDKTSPSYTTYMELYGYRHEKDNE